MGKAPLVLALTFCLLLSSIQSKAVTGAGKKAAGNRLVTEKSWKSPLGLRHDDPVVSLGICFLGNLLGWESIR